MPYPEDFNPWPSYRANQAFPRNNDEDGPRSRVDMNCELDTDTRPESSLRQDTSLVMKSTSRSQLWNILVTPILYLVDVPVHIPPSNNPSTACRRRPLSCGSVSRCSQNTGVITIHLLGPMSAEFCGPSAIRSDSQSFAPIPRYDLRARLFYISITFLPAPHPPFPDL